MADIKNEQNTDERTEEYDGPDDENDFKKPEHDEKKSSKVEKWLLAIMGSSVLALGGLGISWFSEKEAPETTPEPAPAAMPVVEKKAEPVATPEKKPETAPVVAPEKKPAPVVAPVAEKKVAPVATAKKTPEAAPVATPVVEADADFPRFNPVRAVLTPAQIRADGDLKVLNGNTELSPLVDWLIVETVLSHLGSGEQPDLQQALTNSYNGIAKQFAHNLKYPDKRCVPGYTAVDVLQSKTGSLEKNFIRLRDGQTLIDALNARVRILGANLNNHTGEEARLMLEAFGPLLLDPQIAQTAERDVSKSDMSTRKAHQNYTRLLEMTHAKIDGGMNPAEALMTSAGTVSGINRESRKKPLAMNIYTYKKANDLLYKAKEDGPKMEAISAEIQKENEGKPWTEKLLWGTLGVSILGFGARAYFKKEK